MQLNQWLYFPSMAMVKMTTLPTEKMRKGEKESEREREKKLALIKDDWVVSF